MKHCVRKVFDSFCSKEEEQPVRTNLQLGECWTSHSIPSISIHQVVQWVQHPSPMSDGQSVWYSFGLWLCHRICLRKHLRNIQSFSFHDAKVPFWSLPGLRTRKLQPHDSGSLSIGCLQLLRKTYDYCKHDFRLCLCTMCSRRVYASIHDPVFGLREAAL